MLSHNDLIFFTSTIFLLTTHGFIGYWIFLVLKCPKLIAQWAPLDNMYFVGASQNGYANLLQI